MSLRLRESDAFAVDLILDRANAAQGNGNGGDSSNHTSFTSASHAGVSNERITAVDKFLHLLDKMPAGEPSTNLLQRTLDHIAANGNAPLRSGHGPQVQVDQDRPVI